MPGSGMDSAVKLFTVHAPGRQCSVLFALLIGLARYPCTILLDVQSTIVRVTLFPFRFATFADPLTENYTIVKLGLFILKVPTLISVPIPIVIAIPIAIPTPIAIELVIHPHPHPLHPHRYSCPHRYPHPHRRPHAHAPRYPHPHRYRYRHPHRHPYVTSPMDVTITTKLTGSDKFFPDFILIQ